MSFIPFLAVSVIFAMFLPSEGVVTKANTDRNVEGFAERTVALIVASSGEVRNKLLNKRKVIPESMRIGSRQALNVPSGQECSNYTNLTNPDRAQRAVTSLTSANTELCDSGNFNPGWYRFTGEAGDKMASSCVPILRCTTASPGWLNGSHPTANKSLARGRVCFHWHENCCKFEVNIWVRNCGDFYIYELPTTPICFLRYCGNAIGPMKNPSQCGGDLTNLTGQITSPGYPTYMEPITCQWTIKAPLNGKILLYVEDLTFNYDGCSSNILRITADEEQTFCTKGNPVYILTAKRTVKIYFKSVYWSKNYGFNLRYLMVKGDFENAKLQSQWNISVDVNSSSIVQVSWQKFNDSFLRPDQYVYGSVVVCKPLSQIKRWVYVIAKPDSVTINVNGLTGNTEYNVQVVALVAEENRISLMYGSVVVKTVTYKGECGNYTILTKWNRAQGAAGGALCDQNDIDTSAWYRFGGPAGTQIATSCVPKRRCGTAITGWMDGAHPSVQDGVVMKTACFHWFEDCCRWQVIIKVRNCGGFYVYQLHRPPVCSARYCGNKGGCGKFVNESSGTLTSPGYPTRIYWNSKCQWNFTAPSQTGFIVVVVEHLSIPISARCLKFSLSFENNHGKQVGKACGVRRFFTWVSTGSAKLKFHSSRAASRWVGFKARYFIFNDSLTDIPVISQWAGVSAQAINSTAMNVQWDRYPVSPVSPPIIEYIIICVPDGLPVKATVFTTDVSQNSFVVTGLMKFANYTVQIAVQTNGRNSSFHDYKGSQKTRERTTEDVPSEGPSDINVTSASRNRITVRWKPIPKHARNGIITHYVIYYKEAWTSENWREKNVTNTADSTIKLYLEGLKPATKYRLEMAGATSAGVGTKSKAVYFTVECNSVMTATKDQSTWDFSSPSYPSKYPSNLNCTWFINSILGVLNVYVVFYTFHIEKSVRCTADYVSFMQSDGKNTAKYCGSKDPFAVKLSLRKGTGRVKFITDGGLEESGFHARLFVIPIKIYSYLLLKGFSYSLVNDASEVTITWKSSIKTCDQHNVLYRISDSGSSELFWNVTITKTTKATLTGIQIGRSYKIVVLCNTTDNKAYRSNEKDIEPKGTTTGIKTSSPTEERATTGPPIRKDGMYPYGESANDNIIPNTVYYSTRCLRVDIPDDGMQFFEKRHHMIHICRNGLLLFETPQLIRWSRRFSEQRQSKFKKTAIIAPYWALTDVDDSFVTLNISKVFYQVYKDTDNTKKSKQLLLRATNDVATFHVNVPNLYAKTGPDSHRRSKNFKAKWVLVVTWVNLRPPNADRLPMSLVNTFQAVLITDGVYSFAMYNYPKEEIQWSAPTQRQHYKHFTLYRGLPVVGWNAGEKEHEHYDVQGSGQTGIIIIDTTHGRTVRVYKEGKKYNVLPKNNGTWFFRLETSLGKERPKRHCIDWFKKEPDHRRFTENLEPCPCTYRQAFWDERFKMDPVGWPYTCARSIFESDDRWDQTCCYNTATGALVKGYPGGGYPNSPEKNSNLNYDRKFAYVQCCVYSSMCGLFYKKRPSDDCLRYKPTEWSWLWGDPHFVTLDGRKYTFNGLGEYIMTDINNGLFQLQARTKLVGGGGKATVFVSAVAKQNGTSAVQVNLNSSAGLEVLVSGTVVEPNIITNTSTRFNGSIALSRPDNSSIAVLFPSGISVKFTDIKESLAILLAAPQQFKNKTRGLLGVWNDDPLDDLTTPAGRILPNNATSRMIHFDFGQKWQVTESNSLFIYKQGENVNTFSDSSFEPTFIEDYKFANETVKQEALDKCNGDVNCLFDAALTNDVTMGTSTKIVGSSLKNESEALKNTAPMFLNASSIIYVTVNTTARIEIFAKDDDGDPLTFNVSGILSEKLDIFTNASGSIAIVWEVTVTKIEFELTVMDDKGAVALLRPKVYVCACHNGGNCFLGNSNNYADSNDDTFLIMQCNCINGYSGRFCESNLDACQANLNPCYPGVKCTDQPPPADVFGYTCGPCPKGFSGDGATCTDLDECNGGNDGCSQICVNTPGSFVCDCNHGYRLSIDQKTCNDVNECHPASDCMHTCTNTEGSYTCGCNAGFKVNTTDPKTCIPKHPCTDDNHGCQHICYVEDGQQKCSCRQGYELLSDKKMCQDIDECSTGKYRCTQYCHNNQGGYYCTCINGFRLDDDGVTCVDVDECMELTYQCPDPSQICLNTAGTYKCACGPGLYLTVNNTCREIDTDGPTRPPKTPSPPKLPSANEKNNAINITVKGLNVDDWFEPLDTSFKQAVAKAVTSYCAIKADCQSTRRKRRALDYILYTADQVHLLPGFPVQINPNSPDLAAVIALYVNFPPGVVSKSGNSIQGKTLVQIVQSAKIAIETSLNKTISDITLFNKEQPSDIPKSSNLYIIIGGSLAGVVFAVIVILLIRRYISHNGILPIKRNQEKEERKNRSRDVNNMSYDNEFQLYPVSTNEMSKGTGNEYVQTQGGIDNLNFNVD